MNIMIRKATKEDVDAIVRLSNDGGPGGPLKNLPEHLSQDYYDAFERISSDEKHFLMVAEYNGHIVGTFHMCFLTYLAGEGRDDCQVESVHVDEQFHNLGVGSVMMEWVIAEAKRLRCRRVQLTSNKVRSDAHRFYRRLGFNFSHEGAKLSLI